MYAIENAAPAHSITVSHRGNQDDEHVQLYQVLSPVVAIRCLGHQNSNYYYMRNFAKRAHVYPPGAHHREPPR